MSGRIIERRDQVLIGRRSLFAAATSTFFIRWSSANGPFYAGYVASKAGLIGLTRELAASWGRQGIRVNAIAPGFFHSRLADKVIEIYERSIQENNPIPRIGRRSVDACGKCRLP